MNDEKMAILEMLKEGKINADEAERLLHALRGDSGEEKRRKRKRRHRRDDDYDFVEGLQRGFEKLARKLEQTDIGRTVSELVGAAKRNGAGKVIEDIVEEVSHSVSDFGKERGRVRVSDQDELEIESAGAAQLLAETRNGHITLKGSDNDGIRLLAIKSVSGSDEDRIREYLDKVEIILERDEDRVRIYSEIPAKRAGCQLRVDYEISCPAGLYQDLRSLNGNLRAEGITAGVSLKTANGNVVLHGGSGPVRMRTKNGNILAEIDKLEELGEFTTANGMVDLSLKSLNASLKAVTVNGNVSVSLPENVSGQVAAHCVTGHVLSDFAVSGRIGKRYLDGEIGDGGDHSIAMKTIHGAITLKKRSNHKKDAS